MATQAAQAKIQALYNRLEAEGRLAMDDLDRNVVRGIAKQMHVCSINCYNQAGTSGPTESLRHCVDRCTVPHQQANNIVQSESSQFQQRLNRAMQICQDNAQDMMQPGYENDARKMAKVEDSLVQCLSKTVDDHIKLFKPMRQRIVDNIKRSSNQ